MLRGRTAPQVAERLGVGERRVRALAAENAVVGRQLPSGEWLIDSDSVARFELRRKGAGRPLESDTAWAILFELSGLDASGMLPTATYARARKRIRELSPTDLAVAVSGRTTAHRYRSANALKAQAGLIATGRAAASIVGGDLLPDHRRVAGYVPAGTPVSDYARAHFMVEDPTGPDLLYEDAAPGGLATALPGVAAADLALSTDTRERSAGLASLATLKDAWLLAHTR